MARDPKQPSEITHLTQSPEDNCCALVAIANYSGLSYLDVVREFTRLYPSHDLPKLGCYRRQVLRLLRSLGFEIKRCLVKKGATLEPYLDAPVALGWFDGKKAAHLALLRNGLVFETDLTVWPLETYLSQDRSGRLEEVLLPKEAVSRDRPAPGSA